MGIAILKTRRPQRSLNVRVGSARVALALKPQRGESSHSVCAHIQYKTLMC